MCSPFYPFYPYPDTPPLSYTYPLTFETTTKTTPTEPIDEARLERLVNTINFLIDVLVDEEFPDGVYNSEDWVTKQQAREDWIANTFLEDGDLDLP